MDFTSKNIGLLSYPRIKLTDIQMFITLVSSALNPINTESKFEC